MNTIWGVIVAARALLAWGGQTASLFAPEAAAKLGLFENEAEVEPAFWADARGEVLWDFFTLWTLLVAGVLLIVDAAAWPYFGIAGGAIYAYFAGRGVAASRVSHRLGFQCEERLSRPAAMGRCRSGHTGRRRGCVGRLMEVTAATWIIALLGLIMIGLLAGLQLVAALRPRAEWTIEKVYGGSPDATDPKAYFAFNQGFAWADPFFWAPLQIVGSIGMLLGERWGFLLALAAAVPFVHTAIPMYIWDRDMGFREKTFNYWVVVWGMWPAFGLVESVYTFSRLL
jgi:hypothetical protein